MSKLSREQVRFLSSNDLGRLATANEDAQPHVTPVSYELDEDDHSILIPGLDKRSRKFRDLQSNSRVSFVVDDVVSEDPFVARGVVIRGIAEVHCSGGEMHSEGIGGAWLRIRPAGISSWGIGDSEDNPGWSGADESD
jgi:pyridoxamine 5'-phosphate oxidase family protein